MGMSKSERMVRKQLLITAAQHRGLKALAASTGRTEAELVREAIDAKLEAVGEIDWKGSLFAAAAAWPADSDISETVAENRKAWERRLDRLWPSRDKG